MTDIQHEIKIKAPLGKVLEALSQQESLEKWHGAKAIVKPGEWQFVYPNGIEFRWQVVSSSPNSVDWRCVKGPGDSVGTEAKFKLSSTQSGHTLLEFTHAGWPGTHGNFRKCNTLWGGMLHQLKHEVERAAQRIESAAVH
jgi:uncharacterized protein YndB with AHSA1/START domain